MSGCIVGVCDYCNMHVDETDWDDSIFLVHEVFVHEWCVKKYKQGKKRNEYIRSLEIENKAMFELIKKENLLEKLEEMRLLLKG
jgi:hypothetical protein